MAGRELLDPDFTLALLGEVARAALEQPSCCTRGFTVSSELVARVQSCQDLDQLELWAERVLSATSLDEVFAAAR